MVFEFCQIVLAFLGCEMVNKCCNQSVNQTQEHLITKARGLVFVVVINGCK